MKRIGLIAGEGEFPLLFAQTAKSRGMEIITAGIKNHTAAEIESYSDKIQWISLGELDKLIQFFKRETVHEAIMAGRVPKPDFVQGTIPLDQRLQEIVSKTLDHRDTALLTALIREMELSGIRLLDSSLFLQSYLAKEGILGKHAPSSGQWEDIECGRRAALRLGELDIGQTVAVKDRVVVAVEGIEGTDETIRRAGRVAGEGIVVVKMARPRQDMRFDIPVVGPRTLSCLKETKAAVLAVETGKTLILHDTLFFQEADLAGLAVVGLKSE